MVDFTSIHAFLYVVKAFNFEEFITKTMGEIMPLCHKVTEIGLFVEMMLLVLLMHEPIPKTTMGCSVIVAMVVTMLMIVVIMVVLFVLMIVMARVSSVTVTFVMGMSVIFVVTVVVIFVVMVSDER